MGRFKRLPDGSKRSNTVTMRFSDEQKAELKIQAEAAGLTISEYCRKRILGKAVVSRLDNRIVAEFVGLRAGLTRAGALIKHHFWADEGTLRDELVRDESLQVYKEAQAAVRQVTDAITRISERLETFDLAAEPEE